MKIKCAWLLQEVIMWNKYLLEAFYQNCLIKTYTTIAAAKCSETESTVFFFHKYEVLKTDSLKNSCVDLQLQKQTSWCT